MSFCSFNLLLHFVQNNSTGNRYIKRLHPAGESYGNNHITVLTDQSTYSPVLASENQCKRECKIHIIQIFYFRSRIKSSPINPESFIFKLFKSSYDIYYPEYLYLFKGACRDLAYPF